MLVLLLVLNSCADESDYVYINGGNLAEASSETDIKYNDSDTSESNETETIESETEESSETVESTSKDTEAETKAPDTIVTETTEDSETSTPSTEEDEIIGISVASLTKTVKRGNKARLEVSGKPNTSYTIKVYYSNSVSTAKGLEPKNSDDNGRVVWEWRVGTRTKAGNHKIEVFGGGEKLTLYFTTTE